MKYFTSKLSGIIIYVLHLPFKIYYFTWVFVLILFKRKIPRYLTKKTAAMLDEEQASLGEIEKIQR